MQISRIVIGDKTSTASKLILVNGTGAAVKGLYIRPTTDDDDDWGTELINGLFTLNDGDKALYYYEPDEKEDPAYFFCEQKEPGTVFSISDSNSF